VTQQSALQNVAQRKHIKGILTAAVTAAGYCYTPKHGPLLQTALQKTLKIGLTTTAATEPDYYCCNGT